VSCSICAKTEADNSVSEVRFASLYEDASITVLLIHNVI